MNDCEASAQPWAKYKSQITKLVIEEGVVSIGRCNFYGHTAITEVVLPDSLMSIEGYAFFSCSGITEMNIPARVFYIGAYALRKTKLTTLTFENMENWMFVNGVVPNAETAAELFKSGSTSQKRCIREYEQTAGEIIGSGELKGITWKISDTGVLTIGGEGDMPRFGISNAPWFAYHGAVRHIVIEGNVTSIGRCAFYAYKTLISVEITAPVAKISEYSFYNSINMRSVNIPASVTEIGAYAFRKTNLTDASFEIPYGWSSGEAKIEVAELAGNAAGNCLAIQYYKNKWVRDVNAEPEVVDPNYVTHGILDVNVKWTLYWTDDSKTTMKLVFTGKGKMLDSGTGTAPWYEYRSQIVEVEVCEGITTIGRCSFYNLTKLTKVTLNEGLESIGDYAFNKCSALTEITIPSTVTTIGKDAFAKSGLSEIPTV